MRFLPALLLLTLVGACGESPDDDAVVAGADGGYSVLTADGWSLQQAVDLSEGEPFATLERPALDWFGEYVRTTADESQMVRLSGHDAGLDETRGELEQFGFVLEDVAVEGRTALGGSAPSDPAGPTVVLLDAGGATLMVLSYELDLDELVETVAAIEPVTEAEWVEAGGVIR